ncbi:MAG: T9SS type A sorting domain-containing protein [Prevotella sp.]|nr:T9SS type A sorting domain-containing protein [Prevotella sp.]
MKRQLFYILTLLVTTVANAAIGDWKIYLSYSDPQQIERVGELLFVRASNSLYLYNKADQSIQTFDKVTGLNDVNIINIGWNTAAKKLLIVYDNSNIDLMDLQGNVSNISDLYNKIMTEDKTINSITMNGHYAYLATNFGGVKLDLNKVEISESYMLGLQVSKIGVDNDNIYARTAQNKTYKASLSSNLIDKSNWAQVTSWPQTIFSTDNTAYEENIDLVKTLQPGGPKYNYFGYMKIHENKLYTCNGQGWDAKKPASIQIYDIENDEWTTFNNEGIADQLGVRYQDIMTIDVDPKDSRHVVAGAQSGLFEFYDGELTQHWNNSNSPIYSHFNVRPGHLNYQVITSVLYDNDGNLLVANTGSTKGTLLKLSSNTTWSTLNNTITAERADFLKIMGFDSKGYLWMYNNAWETTAAYRYDMNTETLTEYSNFTNEDGVIYTNLEGCRTLAEDKEGNIWVGLSQGLFVLTPEYQSDPSKGFYQVKVPRNDGTNYADYLLSAIDITTIAVDNANRKWIGTKGNGVYLISSDNMVEEKHLTTSNSPLLSNNIYCITIDDNTGIVYIGTDNGLCSYQSEATKPNEEMNSDNVWAYPNPVTPEYRGMITITGLSQNSDIKITSSNGSLVAEGRSQGGSFQWDGNDLKGNRVASGVYMVNTAKKDGTKGTVCKIVIVN